MSLFRLASQRARHIAVRAALLPVMALSAPSPRAEPAPHARAERTRVERVITITASDFAFDMPSQIDAGLVTLRLINRGRELHHVFIAKLKPGVTENQFLEGIKPQLPFPNTAELMGGPNTGGIGGTSEVMLTLAPGNYVAICVFSATDGRPHLSKGQRKSFTVVGTLPFAPEPKADATISFVGYDFVTKKPLRAGTQVIRLENTTTQPHELFLAKLKDGKHPRDVLGWIALRAVTSPVEFLAGSTPFDPGHTVYLKVTLTPGRYAVFCFMPDTKDGSSHLAHGSMKEITVLPANTKP